MTQTSDLLIVGGGLNGPALALAAANAGLSVTIVDALPRNARMSDAFDGRGYALALSSQRLLKGIGVWNDVAPHAQPILDVRITDGKPGEGPAPFLLEFDHAEIDEGPMGYMVEDRHLRRAFLDALDGHERITQVEGFVATQEVDAHSAHISLTDGRRFSASLIAGCDGRKSGTAKRAKIGRTGLGLWPDRAGLRDCA